MIWGTSGAILSVPMTAVFRIVVSHLNHPFAVSMAMLCEGNLTGAVSVDFGKSLSSSSSEPVAV